MILKYLLIRIKLARLKAILPILLLKELMKMMVLIYLKYTRRESCILAIDNSDLKVDTPDSKSQLHATTTANYQQYDPAIPQMPCIKIKRESKPKKTTESFDTIKLCPEQKQENKTYSLFKGKLNFEVIRKSKEIDTA